MFDAIRPTVFIKATYAVGKTTIVGIHCRRNLLSYDAYTRRNVKRTAVLRGFARCFLGANGVDEGSLKVEYRHLCSVFALKTKRRLCFKDNETSPHRINCRVSRTFYMRSPNILKLTQM